MPTPHSHCDAFAATRNEIERIRVDLSSTPEDRKLRSLLDDFEMFVKDLCTISRPPTTPRERAERVVFGARD